MNIVQNFKQNKIWYFLGAGLILAIIGYFLFRKSDKQIEETISTPEKEIDWLANNDNFPLKYGSYGERVKTVQNWLIKNGQSLSFGADGKFGKETETALLNFKNRNNISESYWESVISKS